MESVYRWGRHMNYLFEGCGYQLLLFVESKRSSFSKLMGLFAFLLQKNLETLVTHSSKLVLFIFEREFIGGARLAHNLWKNKAQVLLFLPFHLSLILDSKNVVQLMPHLSARTAVMSPPRLGELGGADHTHGGPLVRDPYGGFGSQRSTIANISAIQLNMSGTKKMKAHRSFSGCSYNVKC